MSSVEINTLPDGWDLKPLGEIVKLQNGFAFKRSLYKDSGTPIVRIKNIKKEEVELDDIVRFNPTDYKKNLDQYKIVENDILIAMSGATTGKIGIYKRKDVAYLNQRVGLFRIENDDLRRYLFYFLSTQVEDNLLKSLGAAQPNLSSSQINEMETPLPPLEEQKRIVAKIDTLFAKIDKAISLTEESLKQAKNLLPSVLGEVFRGLSINNNLVELSDLCDFKNGFAFKSKDFNKVGNGVQVLRIGNVLDVSKNPVYIEKKEAYKGYMLCKNDIVVSMTGTRLKKDYLFVRVIKNEPFYLNQRVGKISSRSFTYYRYIYFYLKSDMFRSEVFKYETGAVNQGNISGKAIMKMLIPKVDIDTQKEIANKCLDVSNQSKQTQSKLEEQLVYLKQLKSSILSKAFKGEL